MSDRHNVGTERSVALFSFSNTGSSSLLGVASPSSGAAQRRASDSGSTWDDPLASLCLMV